MFMLNMVSKATTDKNPEKINSMNITVSQQKCEKSIFTNLFSSDKFMFL